MLRQGGVLHQPLFLFLCFWQPEGCSLLSCHEFQLLLLGILLPRCIRAQNSSHQLRTSLFLVRYVQIHLMVSSGLGPWELSTFNPLLGHSFSLGWLAMGLWYRGWRSRSTKSINLLGRFSGAPRPCFRGLWLVLLISLHKPASLRPRLGSSPILQLKVLHFSGIHTGMKITRMQPENIGWGLLPARYLLLGKEQPEGHCLPLE